MCLRTAMRLWAVMRSWAAMCVRTVMPVRAAMRMRAVACVRTQTEMTGTSRALRPVLI